jgi:phenol 2-monooxygenase (NADPH)
MNVSMQDTYNLGWKLALVVQGLCPISILDTYETERRQIALDLIELDIILTKVFTRQTPGSLENIGLTTEDLIAVRKKSTAYGNGFSVKYGASMLVAKPSSSRTEALADRPEMTYPQSLATNIPLGMRFPSYQVVNQASAQPCHFQQFLKSDGRFRIVLFAGEVTHEAQKARVHDFCTALDSAESFLHRITPEDKPIDSLIEILTIHSSPRWTVELLRDFPPLLRPFDKAQGYDYDKVFTDDMCHASGHGQAYLHYGVNPYRGCVVAVRPDQYVGYIGEVKNVAGLAEYFNNIFL